MTPTSHVNPLYVKQGLNSDIILGKFTVPIIENGGQKYERV